MILSFLRNYRIRERRLWYFQSGLPLAICQKASYHNCKINSIVQVLFELLQKLYSLLKNLRLAINHLCYFWKNLFAQAIYRLHTKYSLKGLQFFEKNYHSHSLVLSSSKHKPLQARHFVKTFTASKKELLPQTCRVEWGWGK